MIKLPTLIRIKLFLSGILQGVGFRPFVYQLAQDTGLNGWIINSLQGVSIEVEGNRPSIDEFLSRLQNENPPNSFIQDIKTTYHKPLGYEHFEIRASDKNGSQSTLILPDIATCADCLQELFDSSNRRHLYPFINCTHCGPRFSIITSMPYDRQSISMKHFQMCHACQHEYDDPSNRRFHAQPNACYDCGPQLELWGSSCLYKMEEALERTVSGLKDGAIIAIKGLGGFHLMANACDEQAIKKLRFRKNREVKPLALMFPNISSVKKICELSSIEERILLSKEAPIVILKRKKKIDYISSQVAPSNPNLGVMLPSNPLHHILMDRMDCPIVATSGNISDETICTKNDEAFTRLQGIADYFLVHNRPIVRHVDDSIVRVVMGEAQILRRARGYAPLPITVNEDVPPMVAVGGHLKNSVALAQGHNIFISQHIGDLGSAQSTSTFETTLKSLEHLCDFQPEEITCDFHPDYPSTHWAEKSERIVTPVQHHVAHIFSCMAENDMNGPLLGVAWDGSGYGLDGTIWGGEFFHITSQSVHRVACWRPFPLPGGEAAVKEPRRSALGLLYEVLGESVFEQSEIMESFSSEEIPILKTMLHKKINCPLTSSCGRLFDTVASMTGIRHFNSFEGQAAMDLEYSMLERPTKDSYTVELIEGEFENSNVQGNQDFPDYYNLKLKYQLYETAMAKEILQDIVKKRSRSLVAVKFHNTLVESIVAVAKQVGEERVVLSGGCFQNKYLTEQTVHRLYEEGFQPYWHQRVPTNDGGLALGQIFASSRFDKKLEVAYVPRGTG